MQENLFSRALISAEEQQVEVIDEKFAFRWVVFRSIAVALLQMQQLEILHEKLDAVLRSITWITSCEKMIVT